MIPLIPALTLALLSFFFSAYVILRTIIPILPPHPLSKRASPAEFGLPTFRTLSPSDKAHVWLASLDLVSVAIFIWHTIDEVTRGVSDLADPADPASSVRMWIILTIRQTIFLIVAGTTLLHVRLGRPVSFGGSHWLLWAPSLILIITSTSLAGVISGAGVLTLFYGLIAYTSILTLTSLVAFSYLLGTLFIINRNLNAIGNDMDLWPPMQAVVKNPAPSLVTEEFNELREGNSWMSFNQSISSCNSFSGRPISTHHGTNTSSQLEHHIPQNGGQSPVQATKPSCRFGVNFCEDIPPVPPFPSSYNHSPPFKADRETVHRDARFGSQSSWLTSTNGSHTTTSAWLFPAAERGPSMQSSAIRDSHTLSSRVSSRPNTPVVGNISPLNCYSHIHLQGGNPPSSGLPDAKAQISPMQCFGWLLFIIVPYGLSLPHLVLVSQNLRSSLAILSLFVLSITLSSPILAVNLLLKCPFPIPTGLFDASSQFSSDLHGPKRNPTWAREPKRSMAASVTVIEDRCSIDIWVSKGDAVDGRGKLSRVIHALSPLPKLSVIPPQERTGKSMLPNSSLFQRKLCPPMITHSTPESHQVDRKRTHSTASSHLSEVDKNLAVVSKIVIAQRHCSALAQTVSILHASYEKEEVQATGVIPDRTLGHLRSRSVSSVSGPSTPTPATTLRINPSPTPPPPFPLPPTPPSVRTARLALAHRKSFSSGFYLESTSVDSKTSAGVLPLNLNPCEEPKLGYDDCPPGTQSEDGTLKVLKSMDELTLGFSSHQVYSTPVGTRYSKPSRHHMSRYSLPGLDLQQDCYNPTANTREPIDTSADASPIINPILLGAREGNENEATGFKHEWPRSRPVGLSVNIPQGAESARASLSTMITPLSTASSATLFGDVETDFAPLAESTPHSIYIRKMSSRRPLAILPDKGEKLSSMRAERSMKDAIDATSQTLSSGTTSPMTSIAQWSTQAVGSFAFKPRSLQRKVSNVSFINSSAETGLPLKGLRPLILLKDRGHHAVNTLRLTETRLPNIATKNSPGAARVVRDENTYINGNASSRGSKDLKPLKLVTSGSSKTRAASRRN